MCLAERVDTDGLKGRAAMVAIKNSVGRNGLNRASDVVAVQNLLNRFIGPGRLLGDPLEPDGIAGSLTKNAIGSFQRVYLGFNNPDRRVDPNGQTLAKLNGPTTAPKLKPTLAPEVEGVLRVLRSSAINSIRFRLGVYSIEPRFFRRVADVIEAGRIAVVHMSALKKDARYTHANVGTQTGMMSVGFQEPADPLEKSIIVHEATHAVCDGWGHPMLGQDAEVLAHLAQGIYYYELTGLYCTKVHGVTFAILKVCVDIAARMKVEKNHDVTIGEAWDLNRNVVNLPSVIPNAGFYYDGI